jgi:AcrR family transcriptional regulator
MVSKKRADKERMIIDAAEKVIFQKGFSAAKMEDVALEAGMSKPSLYFYFQSKQEIYLAITFRAFQMLTDIYYQVIRDSSGLSGEERVLKILESYLQFSEQHFQYHEALFDYLSFVRNHALATDEDDKTAQSIYFQKIRDIHNLPVSIVVKEIDAGKADGSITNPESSETIYLTAWAIVAGYIKLSIYAGQDRDTIHKVGIQDWKAYIIGLTKKLLTLQS